MLLVPTLFGIILINFVIVQFAPGGPIEQIISEMTLGSMSTTAGISGGGDFGVDVGSAEGTYGLDPELIADLERQFGFDKPAHERFFNMVGNYLIFDFGTSYFQDRPVLELIIERLPVSISLGLWSLLLIYGISIPLGVLKAVRDGTRFDIWTSTVVFTGFAIPGFLFAIFLIVMFAGGGYLEIFPMRGLVSDNWLDLSWPDRIFDYLWHMALPITALTIGGFATLTMLTKNSFLEELGKQFVLTARAKGLNERRVLETATSAVGAHGLADLLFLHDPDQTLADRRRIVSPQHEIDTGDNEPLKAALSICKQNLMAGNLANLALAIERTHGPHEVCDLAEMPASVHADRTADGPGNAGHTLDTGKTTFHAAPRKPHQIDTRADLYFAMIPHHLFETRRIEPHHDAVDAVIADQHVRPAAEHFDRCLCLPCTPHHTDKFLRIFRVEQVAHAPA